MSGARNVQSTMESASPVPASAHIPPELWVEIFQLAVYVPGLMDVDVPNPFTSPIHRPPTDYHDMPTVRHSMRTRRVLPLVCRTWHRFSSPFLYEVILLDSERSARCLLRTFEDTQREDRPFGAWTRHLLLGTLIPSTFVHLPDIACHLSHLAILSIWNFEFLGNDELESMVANADFANVLAAKCGPSLQKLHFYAAADVLIPDTSLAVLLQATPNLHTLIIADQQYKFPVSLPPLPSLTFLSIHTPEVTVPQALPDDPNPTSLSFFPSLNHLFLDSLRGRLTHRVLITSGLAPPTLSLDLRTLQVSTANGQNLIWNDMSLLWPLCPSTTHVHIILAWQQFVKVNYKLPPAITHLGIFHEFASTPLEDHSPTFSVDHFGTIATCLRMEHPALKIVRLTNPVFVAWLRRVVVPLVAKDIEDGLGSTLRFCAERLRVEDHEGKLIVPPDVL